MLFVFDETASEIRPDVRRGTAQQFVIEAPLVCCQDIVI
jgi:hypothetical protein